MRTDIRAKSHTHTHTHTFLSHQRSQKNKEGGCGELTDLKALYRGLYQQTKEQGVKTMNQRMERPKVVPPLESTMNHAKLARIFKNSTITWTETVKTCQVQVHITNNKRYGQNND